MKSKDKEEALTPKKGAPDLASLSRIGLAAKDTVEKRGRQIQEGLKKSTASTGTPVNTLHGGALFMTKLSNVGGGSVVTGGGGVKEGLGALLEYTAASSALSTELKQLDIMQHSEDD